eukprot:327989-Pyramimonas_sp.AAC.1
MAKVAPERVFLGRIEGAGAQEIAWFDSTAAALAAAIITVPSALAGATFEDFRLKNVDVDGCKKRCARSAIKLAAREMVGSPAQR